MSFAIGQRWISETENSLGLGMITALDFRSVTLHFPATDETRIYAVAQAPLTRIALNKGEQLHHQAGWQGEVLDIQEMNGLLFYLSKMRKAKRLSSMKKNFLRLSPLAKPKIASFHRKLTEVNILRSAIKPFCINKLNSNRLCEAYKVIVRV